MHKSTLIQILKTFTPKELALFGDFINSPFYNKNKDVINLYNEIKKSAPDLTNIQLEKERVWKKLFPDTEYNYGIMKNLIFDLNRLCEQFMITVKFEKDEPAHVGYLLQSMFDRYLKDQFHKKMEFYEKKFNMDYFIKHNYDSTDFFNFRVNAVKFNQLYFQHFDREYEMINKLNSKTADLIAGYFTEMYRTYNDSLAFANNIGDGGTQGSSVIERILDMNSAMILDSIENDPSEGTGILRLYHLMFECFRKKGKEDTYSNFKKAVLSSSKLLSDPELRNLHMCLINCYVHYPQSGTNNDKELLEIFDSMIEKNIIKAPGEKWIEEHIFSYYIIHCSNLGHPEKIRSFIEKYQDSINPEVLVNLRTEINCLLNFLEKNYEEALKYLNELEFSFFGKKLLSRSLKVKLLYEMDQYESFIYERDAYNHFLNNNKTLINLPGMTENRIAKTRILMDIINNLFGLRNNFNEEKYYELRDKITEHSGTGGWYLEKLREIEKSNAFIPRKAKTLSKSADSTDKT